MLSFISILSWTVFYKKEVLSFKESRRYLQQIKKSQGFLTPFPGKSVVPNRDETCRNSGILWNFNHFPKLLLSYYFLSSQDKQ